MKQPQSLSKFNIQKAYKRQIDEILHQTFLLSEVKMSKKLETKREKIKRIFSDPSNTFEKKS